METQKDPRRPRGVWDIAGVNNAVRIELPPTKRNLRAARREEPPKKEVGRNLPLLPFGFLMDRTGPQRRSV
jgi:hypothetical protein